MKTFLVLPLASLNGWSMRQLADRANVNQTALSATLRGGSGRLSDKSVSQVLDVLELDSEGGLRKGWVYRWQLGEGGGSELDLKTVFMEAQSSNSDGWEEFPLFEKDEENPIHLAFRDGAGIRLLVHLARKPTRSRKAILTKFDYPAPDDIGHGVRWGSMLVEEGSRGIVLTPDQAAFLRNLGRRPTTEWFDALLAGKQQLLRHEALLSYTGLTWQEITSSLKRRYSTPEIAGLFLEIKPSSKTKK